MANNNHVLSFLLTYPEGSPLLSFSFTFALVILTVVTYNDL